MVGSVGFEPTMLAPRIYSPVSVHSEHTTQLLEDPPRLELGLPANLAVYREHKSRVLTITLWVQKYYRQESNLDLPATGRASITPRDANMERSFQPLSFTLWVGFANIYVVTAKLGTYTGPCVLIGFFCTTTPFNWWI